MKKIIYIFVYMLASVSLFAQGGGSVGAADPRAIAMGKIYASTSRGIYAINKNPANLAIPQGHQYEIGTVIPIPNMNFSVGNDFMTLDQYNYYFGGVEDENGELQGRVLTGGDIDNFIALMEQGTGVYSDVSALLFSMSYYHSKEVGSFAITINDRGSVHGIVPKEFVELVLRGNEKGRTFDFGDAQFQSWYLREYGFSYARELPNLFPGAFKRFTFGFTAKYVQGFIYSGFETVKTQMVTGEDNNDILVRSDLVFNIAVTPSAGVKYNFDDADSLKSSSMGLFPSPSGTGFGFDFGFSAELDDTWMVGLAFTDLGSINWDNEAVEYIAASDFVLDGITDQDKVDSLTESLRGEGRYISDFNTGLAAAMRLGVSYDMNSGGTPLLLALEYNQGFNNLPANSTKARFAIGMEYIPLDWLPLRTGFSFGGRDGFNWGFGFGIETGLLEFNLATSEFHSLFAGNKAERVGIALGSRWKF